MFLRYFTVLRSITSIQFDDTIILPYPFFVKEIDRIPIATLAQTKKKSRPKSALLVNYMQLVCLFPINVSLGDIGIFQLETKALGIGNFYDDLTSALEHHILVGIVGA